MILGVIFVLMIGAITGWLTGRIVRGHGQSVPVTILIGVVSAAVFGALGLALAGIVGAIIASTGGAVILLMILRAVSRS